MRKFALMAMLVAATAMRVCAGTYFVEAESFADKGGWVVDPQFVEQIGSPYRSLCCRDIPNLFLAGRCASYTHVAFGSSRVMHAGGQQCVAAGYAASLCKKYRCRPRAIH